jgi:hypothetical protein
MRKLIYPPGGSSGDRDNTIWRNGIIRIFYQERTVEKQEISESWNSSEILFRLSDFFCLSKNEKTYKSFERAVQHADF